jgi:hypothetical protein
VIAALIAAAYFAVSLVAAGVIGRGIHIADEHDKRGRWDW